jgi:putative exosortase-associated protein (TIGR04073 family)
MTKTILSILFSTCLLFASSNTFANEREQSYGSRVGDKALNGVANIFTAILEIPKSIVNTTNESNLFYGVIGGVIKGSVNAAGRFMTGVTDLATAPLPTKKIVLPAYIWDDFETSTTYGDIFRIEKVGYNSEETYSE